MQCNILRQLNHQDTIELNYANSYHVNKGLYSLNIWKGFSKQSYLYDNSN